MLNQVVLVGRLTKELEVITTDKGKKYTYLMLAVQRPFKNVDGIFETDFIRCVLWNVIAENAVEFCHVGDVIGVKGRIQCDSYEDKDGNMKYTTDVLAERITFLSSSKKEDKEKK